MNVASLIQNVLRVSGTLRPSYNTVVLGRYAHQKPVEAVRRPVNEKIPHNVVQIANADGKLESPEALADVLARLDLKKFYVELVAADKAVVKIYNKAEEKAKSKAREKARKARMRANDLKEIQMTWGVAPGDLAHKLDKVRRELEKQYRVSLIFAPKSKQPVPPPYERNEKVAEVLEILKDVGTEWMPRTFKKSLLTIHLRCIDRS